MFFVLVSLCMYYEILTHFPGGRGGARRSLMTILLAFREIIPQSALTAIQNSVLTLNLGKGVYNIRRVTRIS